MAKILVKESADARFDANRRQMGKAKYEANRDAIDAHRAQVRATRAAARKAIKAQSNG